MASEEAARFNFGKHVWDLNLSEASTLAGIIESPQNYSPIYHPEAAKRRQLYVLHRMQEDGIITAAQEKVEAARPLAVHPPQEPNADYYLEEVRRYLETRYGSTVLYEGGLSVTVGMDPALQNLATDAVKQGLEQLQKREELRGGSRKRPLSRSTRAPGACWRWSVAATSRSPNSIGQFRPITTARNSAFKPIVYAGRPWEAAR